MATKLEIKQFGTSWYVGTLVCRDFIITFLWVCGDVGLKGRWSKATHPFDF